MHKITYYLNGYQEGNALPINAPTNIKYIGNSKDGFESFGRIADFRVYPYALLSKNVEELHKLASTYKEDGKIHNFDGQRQCFIIDYFDNIGSAFANCGLNPIPLILNSLKYEVPDMQAELCRLIAAMSTTSIIMNLIAI